MITVYKDFITESSIKSFDNFKAYFKEIKKKGSSWCFKSAVDLPDIVLEIKGTIIKFIESDSLRCNDGVAPYDIMKSELENIPVCKDIKIKTDSHSYISIDAKSKSDIDKFAFELAKCVSSHIGADGE